MQYAIKKAGKHVAVIEVPIDDQAAGELAGMLGYAGYCVLPIPAEASSECFEVDICGLSDPAQAVFTTIKRETGLGNQAKTRRNDHGKILDSLLREADTSPLGLIAMFPERFKGWSAETVVPTPHNVSIDIYGEEFHFKASADEARRLIRTFERVLAARKDVRRLEDELAEAKQRDFSGVRVAAYEGIMVDDPDASGAGALGERTSKPAVA
jgi:hypothetical protein